MDIENREWQECGTSDSSSDEDGRSIHEVDYQELTVSSLGEVQCGGREVGWRVALLHGRWAAQTILRGLKSLRGGP